MLSADGQRTAWLRLSVESKGRQVGVGSSSTPLRDIEGSVH
jgi:hypothetical protein